MPTDLDELERLHKAATPGPWAWGWEDKSVLALYGPREHEHHVLWAQVCKSCQERGNRCTAPNDADCALIEAAVNAMPSLIAEIRELRGAMGRARNRLLAWGDGYELGLNRGIEDITAEIDAAKEPKP